VATDQQGLTHTVSRRLDPKTVDLTFNTVPSGLQLTVGSSSGTTPFSRTVIQGSTNSVSAPSPQGSSTFASWSDGGAVDAVSADDGHRGELIGHDGAPLRPTNRGGTLRNQAQWLRRRPFRAKGPGHPRCSVGASRR